MSATMMLKAEADVNSGQRAQLIQEGFCIFKDVLDGAMLGELRQVTNGLLAAVPAKDRSYYRYQGSNIFIAEQHSVFPRLFTWPKAIAAFSTLGFQNPKWMSAFLLSKPAYAPPLYWHQDWWAWGDPCSANIIPPQLFLMYYLTDTSRENGCLRVIPGTHRKRIPLHDQLPIAHTEASYNASLSSPAFCNHPDAVDICVRAGDLVVGDARLLHAAHGNSTAHPRTCLTLWYTPAFDDLPLAMQSHLAKHAPPKLLDGLPQDLARDFGRMLPAYSGPDQAITFDRVPKEHLK